MTQQMRPGQKVEIIGNTILAGERARIETNPESGLYSDEDQIWIRYDRDGEYLPEKGDAILLPCWWPKSMMKIL